MSKDWTLIGKVEDKIDSNSSKIKFDYRGHWSFNQENLSSDLKFACWAFTQEQLLLIDGGEKLPEPVEISLMSSNQCPYCGSYVKYKFDGNSLVTTTECQYPGGIKDVTIKLNVPSGKMVFANDLREWFKIHGDFNINNDVGQMLTTKAYEKVGMAHGFVSNTCPGVYQVDNENLSITGGCVDVGEETWNDEAQDYLPLTEEMSAKITPPGKRVGGICTDLWWYSVVDFEEFQSRFLDMGGTSKEFKSFIKDSCDVVDVTPGVYTFTHFFRVERWDIKEEQKEPNYYALITCTGEPEVKELYESYKKLNYTIGQCLLASIRAYPTLHGFEDNEFPSNLPIEEVFEKFNSFPIERREAATSRFYDHTFCTLGAGVDWHANGWGSSQEVMENTPDIELPPLTRSHCWYPMSTDYCALYLGSHKKSKHQKIVFNESFLKAAYEVIRVILTQEYNSQDQFWHGDNEEQKLKEFNSQKKIAHKSLKALNKNYPNTMPDSCKELL